MADTGTFAGADEFARQRGAALTPDERLAWLQRMLQFASKSGALARAQEVKEGNSWKYGRNEG